MIFIKRWDHISGLALSGKVHKTAAGSNIRQRVRYARCYPDGSVVHVRGKTRFLFVEYIKMNRKVGTLTLQQFGCEVTLADTGKEAVEMVDGQLHFDLTCMDMNMPVMNSIEAAEAIRDLDHPNATTRILTMTGMAFEEGKQRCLELGMDDVVTKPFDINDLRGRFHAWKNPDSEEVALSS